MQQVWWYCTRVTRVVRLFVAWIRITLEIYFFYLHFLLFFFLNYNFFIYFGLYYSHSPYYVAGEFFY